MAVNLFNNFEGGTSGTTVSTANSGGTSGNAFDAVTIGASATLTFDNSEAAHGTLSGKFVNPASATSCIANWSTSLTGSSLAQAWFRAYVFITANPSATLRLIRALSGATFLGAVCINSTGHITTFNAAGTVQTTSALTVPLSQWFRLEGYFIGSSTAGQVQVKIFTTSDDAVTPDETNTTGAAINTSGPVNTLSYGDPSSVASYTLWLDDLGASDTAYMGPAAVSAAGAAAGLALAAPAGTVSAGASIAGAPAALALAAPAGSLGITSAVTGAVAGLTLTAPAGTVSTVTPVTPGPGGYLTIPPAIAWQAGNGATVSTLAPFTPSLLGPPNVTPWYVPFAGFIERLPQAWGNEMLRNITDATIVDTWASLIEDMQAILPSEILNDDPYAYWPCTDLPGQFLASNLSPGNSNPLVVTASKYGSVGVSQAFGQNEGALLGAQGTLVVDPQFRVTSQAGMWGQTLPATFAAGGWCLLAADASYPLITFGVTFECWFQFLSGTGSPFSVTGAAVLYLQNIRGPGSTSGTVLQVFVDPVTGHLTFAQTGAFTSTNIGGPADYRSMTAPAQLVISMNQATWTSYVNGVQTATGTFSPAFYSVFTKIAVGGFQSYDGFIPGPSSGYIGHVAVFTGLLHPLRVMTHYQAGIAGLAQDTASGRIERLLQAATDFWFRRLIQFEDAMTAGGGLDQVVSCQDIPANPVGTAISNIDGAISPGIVVVTPGGEIFCLAKQNAYNQAVRWVIGELIGAGEIPYQPDIALDYDPTRVLNDIQLTQLDDTSITSPSVTALEAFSQTQYGQVTLQDTGYLHGDAATPLNYGPGLLDLANWIACTSRSPLLRGSTVTIDAAAFPMAWPIVLGASCADMVTLNVRPQGFTRSGLNPAASVTGRISQTERTMSFGWGGQAKAQLQVIVDPAPEVAALTCDDPELGQLNGVNVLGW